MCAQAARKFKTEDVVNDVPLPEFKVMLGEVLVWARDTVRQKWTCPPCCGTGGGAASLFELKNMEEDAQGLSRSCSSQRIGALSQALWAIGPGQLSRAVPETRRCLVRSVPCQAPFSVKSLPAAFCPLPCHATPFLGP